MKNLRYRFVFGKHELSGSSKSRVAKIVAMVVLGIVGLAVLALIFGIFVKLLWNALMPAIFGLPEIGFWQAVGLVVLAHIFFGGEHRHRYERSSRTSRKEPSDESSFHSEMERDYRLFWREEGREAFRDWIRRENGTLYREE